MKAYYVYSGVEHFEEPVALFTRLDDADKLSDLILSHTKPKLRTDENEVLNDLELDEYIQELNSGKILYDISLLGDGTIFEIDNGFEGGVLFKEPVYYPENEGAYSGTFWANSAEEATEMARKALELEKNPTHAWVVFALPENTEPADDESLKSQLKEALSISQSLEAKGLTFSSDIEENLKQLIVAQNEHLSKPIQHAAFTNKALAKKLCRDFKFGERQVVVLELPIESVSTPINKYRTELLNDQRPFTIQIQDGAIFEYSGYGSPWETNIESIDEVTWSKDDSGETMNGTFFGKDSEQAISKAENYWTKLVSEGKLSVPFENDDSDE